MKKLDIIVCIASVLTIIGSFWAFDDYCDKLTAEMQTATETIVEQTTVATKSVNETERTTTTTTETPTTTTLPAKIDIGECRISAYCGCPNCCGAWAQDGVIRGASGFELCEGVSCACNGFEFGTVLYVDGIGEFIVQDRVAEWVDDELGKTVDIYFDDHDSAIEFGLKWANVRYGV